MQEQNDAGDALSQIGEPAVAQLLKALRDGSPRVAERCGWVLGRIRSPGARHALLDLARDKALLPKTRVAVARAMGGYKDAAFLDTLAGWALDPGEPREVKRAAAYALRGTLDGRTDMDALAWATRILDGLADRDVGVRGDLLQALLGLRAPYDLARLAPLLRDERVAYLDVRVCDIASWCVLGITGKTVEGADEATAEPEMVRFVEAWLTRTRTRLAWDPEALHYRERKS